MVGSEQVPTADTAAESVGVIAATDHQVLSLDIRKHLLPLASRSGF